MRELKPTSPVHVTGWVESSRHGLYLCCAEVHQAGLLAVRATAKFMTLTDPSPKFSEA
jgi:hypothetical protein